MRIWQLAGSAVAASLALCPAPLLGQGAPAATSQVLTPQAIAARATAAVIRIQALDGAGTAVAQGSGFVVLADGTLVTNYHVVEGAEGLRVHLPSGEIYDNVFFVTADPQRDLAVLRVPLDRASVLPLGDDAALAVGERVYAMGAPMGLEGTFSDGLVSAKRTVAGMQLVQITAPISHGSSGGPILNARGEVVAVATLVVEDGQNLNLAVPARYIRPLLTLGGRPQRFQASLVPPRGGVTSAAPATGSKAATEPRQFVPTSLDDPTGSYDVSSLPDPIRGRIDGRLIIAPYLEHYLAYGLFNLMDSAGQMTGSHVIRTPFTARTDGRVAMELDGDIEGVHLGERLFVLAPARLTLEEAQGRDFVVLTPSEDVLSNPSGIYEVHGTMRFRLGDGPTTRWGGTVGVTTTGFQSRITKRPIIHVVATVRASDTNMAQRSIITEGELEDDGQFRCDPYTLTTTSGTESVFHLSGLVRNGSLQLTIAVEARAPLAHDFYLQGTKIRP